jgi:predicted thioesterase
MINEVSVPIGLRGKMEKIVTAEQTALSFGSGLVEVFATPSMVALMETTAMRSLGDYLPGHLTSVGTSVNIRHLKASPVGRKLHCESRVIEVQGRKIIFEVSVWDGETLAGHGTHVRYIVNKEEFMSQFSSQ